MAREAEVGKLGCVVVREKDVLSLNIAMHNWLLEAMKMLKGLHYAGHDAPTKNLAHVPSVGALHNKNAVVVICTLMVLRSLAS